MKHLSHKHTVARAQFTLALLTGWLACAHAQAALQVIGTQYRVDHFFPEFYCYYSSGNYPTSCPTNIAPGAMAYVFVKNTGASAVTIDDATLAGYSLQTVIKMSTSTTINPKEQNSIYFYWDEPPRQILDAGEPVWWKADPPTVPAGGVAQVAVRLRHVPTNHISFGVVSSAGTVTQNITVDANAPRIQSIGYSEDRKKIYIYWRRNGGAAPASVWLNGTNVTSLTTTVSDPSLNLASSLISLSTPLPFFSYNVYQGVYGDGKTATAGQRAWTNKFIYCTWSTFEETANYTAVDWVNEAAAHGFNNIEMNLGVMGGYMGTVAGRNHIQQKGYGYTILDKTKLNPLDPDLWFLNDEPELQENNQGNTHCGTGLRLPCDSSKYVGTLVMKEAVRYTAELRALRPNVATTVNIDGGLQPHSWYTWGPAVDVLESNNYYEVRLRDSYFSYPNRLPLHNKPKVSYAVARSGTEGAAPNPFRHILYSCKGVDPDWPYPFPASKRIEAYYSLAGGTKGFGYWWFNPPRGLYRAAQAPALWKEMGLIGNEVKAARHLIVRSTPIDLPLTPSAKVWAKAVASGIDTLILYVVNDNYVNDINGCHVTNVPNATVTATLPAWMQSGLSGFEITAGGLRDVSLQQNGGQLQVNLGTLTLTRMIVLTTDPTLRTTTQQWYDTQVKANVCSFAPELCVNNPPAISTQPANLSVPAGNNGSFTVVASGTSPLSYRWQKSNVNLNNGGNVSGATTATLTISNVNSNDAAGYRCVITNAYGSVTSSVATLTVTAPGAPSAPTALAATALANTSFTANWIAVSGATGYRLDVATDNGFNNYVSGYQNMDVGNVTSRSVSGLPPGATYYYRVRAYNGVGDSPPSGTITVVLTVTIADTCFGVVNADFEGGFSSQGGGMIGNNWTEWEASPGVCVGYAETTIKRSGTSSQRLRVWGAGGTSGGVHQRLSVIPGELYTVSVWIYAGDAGSQCSLGVDPGGGTSPTAAEVQWSAATTNVAWVQRTWVGTATADYLTIYYKVASSDSTQRNGYFDDATPAGVATGPRQLMAERSGNTVILNWPACLSARLERATSLTPPMSWATATNQVSVVGDRKRATVSPQGGAGYFRLVLE